MIGLDNATRSSEAIGDNVRFDLGAGVFVVSRLIVRWLLQCGYTRSGAKCHGSDGVGGFDLRGGWAETQWLAAAGHVQVTGGAIFRFRLWRSSGPSVDNECALIYTIEPQNWRRLPE